jgi:acetyltransferase-like isoleucine patch superfamily enzyme/dTDP-4-dehydrorhamnose 3,5-epimerase-like enzyme
MISKIFIHPTAETHNASIGKKTNIWQYTIILGNARIGEDCNICSHVFIENDVVVGNRVTIKNGVQLWDGIQLCDDVFIGPNVSFTNDTYPRSKKYPNHFLTTKVNNGASIGAGSVILPGLEIGEHAMVGAGAVVTRSVPPYAIVVGNPARIVGYVNAKNDLSIINGTNNDSTHIIESIVKGVTLRKTPCISDIRGNLTVGEFSKSIPFDTKRFFIIHNVPSKETRGEHAHKLCHQYLICVSGSCSVVVDDGINREEFELNEPHVGIHIPPKIWGIQYKYSNDAVLLVFASEYYDSGDYIRKYSDFLKEIR